MLQEAASDVFAMAAAERWNDSLSRKALQFIERRQRDRAALDKNPFASLDDAVAAAQEGVSRRSPRRSYLSGVKPVIGPRSSRRRRRARSPSCARRRACPRALWGAMAGLATARPN